MAQIKATAIRAGMAILFNNEPHMVVGFTHVTPGKGNAVVQAEIKNMRTGKIFTNRYRSTEALEEIFLEECVMQFLYEDGEFFHFMNVEDYDQIEINAEVIGDLKDFLKENLEISILFYNNSPVDFKLPASIDMLVAETDPGVKGNSISNVYKPAVMETGLTVQVPLFINQGETIKVDTRTKSYMSRA